ncbi:hypothetical protein Glove_122g87 [Diversispora epigaea]|uniref:Uncharacterized protein n=1 Tax=Diversispora epigaea TaxID=1348612 RepID=A0A397IYX3_9GLOM|nr:hypothetical protein Glove_122g87 [Diversispora epigaea]
MSLELLWPYVRNYSNPSVERYLLWVKEQNNPIYQIKYKQIFYYLQAIINYRTAILADEKQLIKLHPDIRNPIEEVNKALKSLIPSVLQQYHWEIAAPHLRKLDFLNPVTLKPSLRSLDREFELSIPSFKPIPITLQEEIAEKNELNITRVEILRKIESLLEQMNDSVCKKYREIGSKKI